MEKYNLDLNFVLDNFFGINEKELDNLIFKLKNKKELNFSDSLLICRIKILNILFKGENK